MEEKYFIGGVEVSNEEWLVKREKQFLDTFACVCVHRVGNDCYRITVHEYGRVSSDTDRWCISITDSRSDRRFVSYKPTAKDAIIEFNRCVDVMSDLADAEISAFLRKGHK